MPPPIVNRVGLQNALNRAMADAVYEPTPGIVDLDAPYAPDPDNDVIEINLDAGGIRGVVGGGYGGRYDGDIAEVARRQDAERTIAEDQRYFENTGVNVLTPPSGVNIIGTTEPAARMNDPISRKARAQYMEREKVIENRQAEQDKRDYEEAHGKSNDKYKNSIMSLDFDDF